MRPVPFGVAVPWLFLSLASCSTAPSRVPEAVGPPAPASAAPAPGRHAAIILPVSPLTPDQQALHVLYRLGYGPRRGDLERVNRIGVAAYIQGQLDPASLPDPDMEPALRAYRTLAMAPPALVSEYPRPSRQARQKVASGEMTRKEMAEAFPPERRPYQIVSEMQAAKLTRALFSERQLEEVMVDFWFNHFNVFVHKGPIVWMLPSYEREAIRPHALGRFRDLLLATARHPAMLYYLDNWMSARSDTVVDKASGQSRKRGLNENYGRELMELHTLGVDGGYTQQDVIEVARCFTGWTIDGPQQGGDFVFRPRAHDQGQKRVLGHIIPAGGGERDGIMVIDLLARHPSTARFVSTKLVRRFVSDDPPAALIERAAAAFGRTDGDIRAVLATIFTSPEFFSAAAYRAKVKTPLEVVASAARATGAGLEPIKREGQTLPGGPFALARQVAKLGEPLYEATPPTGYPDRAEAWVNTGALLSRMNFALALTQNRIPGVRVELAPAIAGADLSQPQQVLDRLVAAVLHGEMTAETRKTLAAELDSPEITRVRDDDRLPQNTDVDKLAALVLGSPEFQRR
jgi:uncharacterized protein (DUF1800 family)